MKAILIAAALAAFTLPAVAGEHGHGAHAMPAAAEAQLVDATVKKVDKPAGKVTLAHGPLTNLNMPAMTMAFKVKEAAWLDQMKEGDKIRCAVDSVKGALTVVRYEPSK